jgi:hypothetical protein
MSTLRCLKRSTYSSTCRRRASAYSWSIRNGISAAEVEVVRDGDAILLPEGYHPNVAIPGATLNFVWIMAAHREVIDRKGGVVQVDPRYT